MKPLFLNSRVLTVDLAVATLPFIAQGGLLFDAEGRLIVTSTNPVATFLNGLPMDAEGALCVSAL